MKFVRFILILLNIGISFLLVFTAFGRYLNPQYVWYFEFISLGYPIYVFINICCIIFWLLGKNKKYALISFFGFLFSFSTFFETFAFSGKTEIKEPEKTIKVISYNVNAFNYNGWKERVNVQSIIFNYLKSENPDIICVQEFHDDKYEKYQMLDSIRIQLGINYSHIYRIHQIKDRYFYGNVIFSRFPIIRNGVFLYQKTGNTTLWADIVRNGDTIRVYNNHLESYRLKPENIETIENASSAEEFQTEKLKNVGRKLKRAIQKRGMQTAELIEAIKECPYKIIVCGDFNSPPYSFTYKSIKDSKNLKDAFLESDYGIGGTLHWKLPSKRLDYILYSPEFESLDYNRTMLQYSDHFPIEAVIKVEQ